MRTTRFLQGLSLTTFSIGVFNTIRGNKTSVLEEKIIKHEAKYEAEEIHNMYESVNNKFDSFINKINTLLNNNNKSQYLDSLQSFFDGFNYEQNLAMSNIK